jgi:hypothetical protein
MSAQKQAGAHPPVEIDRFTFWNGQTLRSNDLNRIVRVSEELQWWHNRALHNAYGIRSGLDATPEPNAKSKKPLSGIHVVAGIAYDSFGRMLFHQQDELVAVPETLPSRVSSLLLLLRYPQAPEVPCGCAVAPPCCLGHTPHGAGWAEFAWRDAASVRPGDGVPLARVKYLATGKSVRAQFDSTFRQPRVRAYQRPHLITDKTVPGSTSWTKGPNVLQIIPTNVRQLFWQPVDVVVDTSAAGFSDTPCYFASISGPLVDASRQLYLPAAFPHIVREFRDRFTFRFWIPSLEDELLERASATASAQTPAGWVVGFPRFVAFARRQQLCVTWLGCEMAQETSPQDFARLAGLPCGCGSIWARQK